MNWKSFSENKNVDDPKTHEEFLQGGIDIGEQFFDNSLTIRSEDVVKPFFNLFAHRLELDKRTPNFLNKDALIKHIVNKIALDLLSYKLIHHLYDYDGEFNKYAFFLNYVKNPINFTPNVFQNRPSIFWKVELINETLIFRLSSKGRTTDIRKYNDLWSYCSMAVTKIVETMERRLQNLIDASRYRAIGKSVKSTLFDDVFSDRNPANFILLQVYNENKKYLKYIEDELEIPIIEEFEGQETSLKSFDLQTLVQRLEFALMDDSIGFFIEENYPDSTIGVSSRARSAKKRREEKEEKNKE